MNFCPELTKHLNKIFKEKDLPKDTFFKDEIERVTKSDKGKIIKKTGKNEYFIKL